MNGEMKNTQQCTSDAVEQTQVEVRSVVGRRGVL